MSPKISAATVKEHHDNIYERLVDAAEEILRADGPRALTAGAVAKRAGIARNSIYRYVSSIDDLRVDVVERYIPRWQSAISKAVEGADTPADKLVTLAMTSLDLAGETGHGWLMDVMTTSRAIARPGELKNGAGVARASADPAQETLVVKFHRDLAGGIIALLNEIDSERAQVNARLVRSLLDSGMKALDEGLPAEQVKTAVSQAVRAVAE